jgi:hypothetical protein
VAVIRTCVSEERIASNIKVLQLLITANAAPNLLILFTLMMEAVFLRNDGSYKSPTASHPNDGIPNSHRRENIKSSIALTGLSL